jgi:hypothetical protein
MQKSIILATAAASAFLAMKAAPVSVTDPGLAFKRTDTVRATTFVPIFKVDAETRTVYGRLADETEDLTGEVFDYDTSAPLFRTWSENAQKASGGKSAGNLRVMHGLKVAGKLVEITFDDAAKTIDIAAKVLDDQEWAMVEEGAYTGFSLGGRYLKKWKDAETKKTRYTVNPFEASLVDLPCIPTATFSFKAAGGEERQVEFVGWTPSTEEIAAKAAELAGEGVEVTDEHTGAALEALQAEYIQRAAETEVPAEVVAAEEAAEPAAEGAPAVEATEEPAEPAAGAEGAGKGAQAEDHGFEQVWRDRVDGSVHASKAAARAHRAQVEAQAETEGSALGAALTGLKAAIGGDPEAEAQPTSWVVDGAAEAFAAHASVHQLYTETVASKGIHDVRSLASILQDLQWLTDNSICEAGHEKDGSPVPAQLLNHLRSLSSTLVTMAKEETSEMIARLQKLGVDVRIFEAPADGGAVTRAVEVQHGEAAKADGAEAEPAVVTVSAEVMADVEKAAGLIPAGWGDAGGEPEPTDWATKAAQLEARNAALEAQHGEVAELVETATKTIADLRADVDRLKAEPLPGAPRTGARVVTKAEDVRPGSEGAAAPAIDVSNPDAALKALVEKHGQEAVSAAAIKLAHQTPRRMG